MPIFRYRGKKKTGEAVSGEVRARSRDEAIEIVSQQGVLPMVMEEYRSSLRQKTLDAGKHLSFKTLYVFTRQLSSLIKAGVPILRSLEIIGQQTAEGSLAIILEKIQQGIREGKTFSDCLAEHPKDFTPLFVSMVRVGEEGGNLRETLLIVSDHQKRQHEFFLKVRTAMTYPLFMAVVGMFTVLFILTFVMPKISKLFIDLNQALPLPTYVLMQISQFLVKGWFIVIPASFLLVFSLLRWLQSAKGRLMADNFLLHMPIIGPLMLRAEFARFCRTLEMLTKSGVSLLRGIQIAIPTVNNAIIREDLLSVKSGLEAGSTLSNSFKACQHVPSMMVHLVGVAEESGLLEETLRDIADTYEEEVNELLKSVTTILEPLMILVVGAVVGFIVIAMLLPIFQMDALAR